MAGYPGSLEAIKRLNDEGYDVCIATNQSGLGRNLFTVDTLAEIHQKFIRSLETLGGHIHMIAYCPHLPADQCHCRKPNTGLLRAINNEFHLDADTTWMVGDTAKDIECAVTYGHQGCASQNRQGTG